MSIEAHKKVDLHIHTTASDGTWNNEELIEQLVTSDIKYFSITDHDTFDNSILMKELVKGAGLVVIPGIEITCSFQNEEYHVLAYACDENTPALIHLIEQNLLKRNDLFDRAVAIAAEKSCLFNMEDYKAYSCEKSRGGWRAKHFLEDKKFIKSSREFHQFVRETGINPAFPHPEKVIQVIRQSNGFAFLAHPSKNFADGLMPPENLKLWWSFGISGVECFHPSFKKESVTKYYIDFCKKHNLMISGGSDSHGAYIPSRKLGQPQISRDMIDFPFS
jgi:hypothetical protein